MLENDIVVAEEYFRGYRGVTEEDISCQFIVIQSVHKVLAGYYCSGLTRINSSIGKRVESIKVMQKILNKDIALRGDIKDTNCMDLFILENGEKLLNRVDKAIEDLKEIDYLGIIKRSMKKNEICLGRVDEGNLRVVEAIEVGSLKGATYNLVEEDIYNYLKRIKRRDKKGNLDKYIDEYIRLSHLNKHSKDYISILLSIPYDSLKQWYRYKYNKKNLLPEEYLKNIKASMEYEI